MKQFVTCENSRRLGVPVEVNENTIEHCLSYTKQDGTKVEIALVHVPGMAEPIFAVAEYPPAEEGSEDIPTPSTLLEVSLAELRVRFHFLEQLFEAGVVSRQA